nr:hypothetical protein [Tanacetum cinerariifolium]
MFLSSIKFPRIANVFLAVCEVGLKGCDFEEHVKKPKRAKKHEPAKQAETTKKTAFAKKSSTIQTAGVVTRDTPGVSVSKKKAQAKVDRGKGMDLLFDVALLEATRLKKVLKKSKQDTHMLHVSGSNQSESENKSWRDSGDDDDSNDDDSNDDGNNVESNDDHEQANDEWTKSDDDDEEKQDDKYVHTPENYEPTEDEMNDESDDVTEEEYERTNEELYGDVNVRLTDVEPNDEDKGNQVKDDAQATQKIGGPILSSSISSDYAAKYLNFDNIPVVDINFFSMLDINVQHEVPHTSPFLTIIVSQYVPEKSTEDIIKIKMEHARKQQEPTNTSTLSDTSALDEFDQKMTLFQTMTNTKSFNRSPKQRALYHALIESILEDEDAMDEGVADKLKKGNKIMLIKMKALPKSVDFRPPQTWINKIAQVEKPPLSFDELMSAPIDFSTYVMNNLKIDNLTEELLVGLAFNLLKETSRSLWKSSRQVALVDYFINNDLEYLRGGSSSKKYTTSHNKNKPTKYDIPGIEDMVLSLWSPKLSNLERDVIFDLGVALQMFTRRIVILKRVKYLQLGVESYQKKLNITKPETFRSDISNKTPYTAYMNSQGIIYVDKYNRNRLMRSDELYNFSGETLTSVRTMLHDIASNLRMDYLLKRRWSNLDRQRSHIMIKAIDKLLLKRRASRKMHYSSFQVKDEVNYEHVGPKVTSTQDGVRSQDDDQRLCLVDDLKEVQALPLTSCLVWMRNILLLLFVIRVLFGRASGPFSFSHLLLECISSLTAVTWTFALGHILNVLCFGEHFSPLGHWHLDSSGGSCVPRDIFCLLAIGTWTHPERLAFREIFFVSWPLALGLIQIVLRFEGYFSSHGQWHLDSSEASCISGDIFCLFAIGTWTHPECLTFQEIFFVSWPLALGLIWSRTGIKIRQTLAL